MTEHNEILGTFRPFGLTKQEHKVLERICLGEANKEIAIILQLDCSTVKVYVRKILKKIGATNRTKAALIATGHLVHVEGKKI